MDPSVEIEDYKPILSREIFEYQLDQNLGLPYDEAEEMANSYEKIVCGELDIDWDEHQERFKKAMEIVTGRKGIKNPSDVVKHTNPSKAKKPKVNKPESKPDVEEIASEGRSSMRSETGDKEAKVGGSPAGRKDIQAQETHVVHDVNIKVSTEPLKLEQGKSEVVIVQTSKPEVEKALAELKAKQDETSENLTKVSDEIKARQDALKILEEKKNEENKAMSEKKLTAEITKINMEIVNLEAERQRIEADKRAIEETAQRKQDLLKQIEDKIKSGEA